MPQGQRRVDGPIPFWYRRISLARHHHGDVRSCPLGGVYRSSVCGVRHIQLEQGMSQEVKFYACEIIDDRWSTSLRTHRCICPVCQGSIIVAEKPGEGYQLVSKCQHYMGASTSMASAVVVCFRMEKQPEPPPKKRSFWA